MARPRRGSILSRVPCVFCGCEEVMVMHAEMAEDMPPSAAVILECGHCAHQFRVEVSNCDEHVEIGVYPTDCPNECEQQEAHRKI
jgi:transcription elongation factor Elf1